MRRGTVKNPRTNEVVLLEGLLKEAELYVAKVSWNSLSTREQVFIRRWRDTVDLVKQATEIDTPPNRKEEPSIQDPVEEFIVTDATGQPFTVGFYNTVNWDGYSGTWGGNHF